jgi:hypothetical protein
MLINSGMVAKQKAEFETFTIKRQICICPACGTRHTKKTNYGKPKGVSSK